jgi:hypothetical protein
VGLIWGIQSIKRGGFTSTVEEIQRSSDPIDPFLEFEDLIIFENPKNRIE